MQVVHQSLGNDLHGLLANEAALWPIWTSKACMDAMVPFWNCVVLFANWAITSSHPYFLSLCCCWHCVIVGTALLLLLQLKVGLHVVSPLYVWVVPPFWIVCVGVGVVLPLIVVDKVCSLSLLKGKTSRLIVIALMPTPQKSQDELIWMELIVATPNCFVITASYAWMADSVSSLCTPVIFFAGPLDDCHW